MFPIGQLAFQEVTMANLDDWGSMVLGHCSTISTCSLPRVHFSRRKQCCCSREIFFFVCRVIFPYKDQFELHAHTSVLFCFVFVSHCLLCCFILLCSAAVQLCILHFPKIVHCEGAIFVFYVSVPSSFKWDGWKKPGLEKATECAGFSMCLGPPPPPTHTHSQWLWNTGLCI